MTTDDKSAPPAEQAGAMGVPEGYELAPKGWREVVGDAAYGLACTADCDTLGVSAEEALRQLRDKYFDPLHALECSPVPAGEQMAPGREHLTVSGTFKSDKYPGCPAGKVPLSIKDPLAQDLLWEYARRHEAANKHGDGEFPRDVRDALTNAGYAPAAEGTQHIQNATDGGSDNNRPARQEALEALEPLARLAEEWRSSRVRPKLTDGYPISGVTFGDLCRAERALRAYRLSSAPSPPAAPADLVAALKNARTFMQDVMEQRGDGGVSILIRDADAALACASHPGLCPPAGTERWREAALDLVRTYHCSAFGCGGEPGYAPIKTFADLLGVKSREEADALAATIRSPRNKEG